MSLTELLERVAEVLEGTVDMQTVVSNELEADVRMSDEFEPKLIERDAGDFIHYPYSVEVEAIKGTPLQTYLDLVGRLMVQLCGAGAAVVASCDWERDLPGFGKLGAPFM